MAMLAGARCCCDSRRHGALSAAGGGACLANDGARRHTLNSGARGLASHGEQTNACCLGMEAVTSQQSNCITLHPSLQKLLPQMATSRLNVQLARLHPDALLAAVMPEQQPTAPHLPGAWCGGGQPPAEKLLRDAPPPPDISALIPTYWRRLEAICPEAERQYKNCAQRDPAQRSSPLHVAVEPFQFGGVEHAHVCHGHARWTT